MYSPAQYWDVLLVGNLQGQVVLNHFWYGTSELGLPWGGAPAMVAQDFITVVLPKIVAVAPAQLTYTSVEVQEHVAGTSVATVGLTADNVGIRPGEALPSFNAWSFRSQRYSRDVPRAQKRFAGVSETDQVNGIAAGSILDELTDLEEALGTIWDAANDGNTDLVPLAISRVDNSVTPHVTRPVPLFEAALNWQFRKISSQVSRRV